LSTVKGKGAIKERVFEQTIYTSDAAVAVVRAEVRRAIDTYAPGGAFLPCIASLECIHEHVTPIVIDKCNRYGAEWLRKQRS